MYNDTQFIDRSSPVPAYYQIATDIKNTIIRRGWEVGKKLPSENELSNRYQVSRVTLRQALAELEKDGIIIKRHGEGSFVNANPAPFVTDLNYALITNDQLAKSPNMIRAEVLEQSLITNLFPNVCQNLQLKPSDNAVYIKRLYYLNDRPLAIIRSYINANFVPGFDTIQLDNNSVSLTMTNRYGLTAEYVDDYIETVRATKSECTLLKKAADIPLILVQAIAYLPDMQPLEYSTTLWSGDSVRLHLQLRRRNNSFIVENTIESCSTPVND